ncbi:MAG: type VI secretion system-associated FHA domain protein TagH [Gammaproteobacteria bacterium]
MPLTLTITSYQRLAPGQNTSKTFDRCNASIGRGPENDWVLPDPEMVLSRKHCMIEYRDSQYYLIDSSVNGVFVNQSQERLGRGNAVLLKDGDELILGDYEIIVGLSEPGNLAAGPLPSSGPKDFLNENSDIFATAKPPPTPGPGPGVPGPGASLGLDSLIMAPVAARNNLPPPAELTSGEASGPFSLGLDSLGLGPGPAGNRPAPPSTASAPANSPDPLGLNQPANPLWKQHSGFDHLPSDQEFFRPPSAVPDNANGAAGSDPAGLGQVMIMAKPAPAEQALPRVRNPSAHPRQHPRMNRPSG